MVKYVSDLNYDINLDMAILSPKIFFRLFIIIMNFYNIRQHLLANKLSYGYIQVKFAVSILQQSSLNGPHFFYRFFTLIKIFLLFYNDPITTPLPQSNASTAT